MKRKSFSKADCPVARALDIVGDWWTLLIVRDAFDGVHRFKDFQENLGIAKNILAERLRFLQEQGILEVVPASDGSAYQEYVLSEKGKDLFYVILTLRQWGEKYAFTSKEKHSVLIERETKKIVPPLKLKSSLGKLLTGTNTEVRKI